MVYVEAIAGKHLVQKHPVMDQWPMFWPHIIVVLQGILVKVSIVTWCSITFCNGDRDASRRQPGHLAEREVFRRTFDKACSWRWLCNVDRRWRSIIVSRSATLPKMMIAAARSKTFPMAAIPLLYGMRARRTSPSLYGWPVAAGFTVASKRARLFSSGLGRPLRLAKSHLQTNCAHSPRWWAGTLKRYSKSMRIGCTTTFRMARPARRTTPGRDAGLIADGSGVEKRELGRSYLWPASAAGARIPPKRPAAVRRSTVRFRHRGALKRSSTEQYGPESTIPSTSTKGESIKTSRQRDAVVGGGPVGFVGAHDLALMVNVYDFEAVESGGMLYSEFADGLPRRRGGKRRCARFSEPAKRLQLNQVLLRLHYF